MLVLYLRYVSTSFLIYFACHPIIVWCSILMYSEVAGRITFFDWLNFLNETSVIT